MTDGRPNRTEATAPRAKVLWRQRGILGAVCALVIAVYAGMAHSGLPESLSLNAAESYYNLLVQGFRAGQLNLKLDVPAGLAQLADPYDPTANAHYRGAFYRLHDVSYYKGKLYLYFGVVPALILFWPFVALTGHYLFHSQAVTIFCAIGFLASVGLLSGLWRRCFPEVSVWVAAAGVLALGLTTGMPVMLARCSVYEVAISCGYMLTMLSLGAIWRALHGPKQRRRWLAAASVAYGLALGARPSLLFGAVILLVPVAQAWRERQPVWSLLIAAIGPIVLIGSGLMLYNSLRFDSPFEFGQRYQLAAVRQDAVQHFSLRYLWFNFRVYFLEPVRWRGHFPFVSEIAALPTPTGQGLTEDPFGVLIDIPVVWLALGVPLAWRGRSTEAQFTLRGFLVAVFLLLGTCTLTLGLYYLASVRFEAELLPASVLLAVAGIFELECALAHQPVWRHVMRCGWGLLLGFSVAFNLFASVEHYAEATYELGIAYMELGKPTHASERFAEAVRLDPNYAVAHSDLGLALEQDGRIEEAARHYEQAVRLQPDLAEAHYNLGGALMKLGKTQEAIRQYEQALRLKPDDAQAHSNLGVALRRMGRIEEAIAQYKQALQIKPDSVEAHCNLGIALFDSGRVTDAIDQYEQALGIKPDQPEVHYNLGNALLRLGSVSQAIEHYEQAVRLNPDFADAHYNLGLVLAKQGRSVEAVDQFHKALELAHIQHNNILADAVHAQLKLYETDSPNRQTP